jgi:hypothetical protein
MAPGFWNILCICIYIYIIYIIYIYICVFIRYICISLYMCSIPMCVNSGIQVIGAAFLAWWNGHLIGEGFQCVLIDGSH